MNPQQAVWVLSGGFPCGARDTGPGEPKPHHRTGKPVPTRWLLVSVMGQVIPQNYRKHEAHRLGRGACPRLGLCDACLGFGGTGDPPQICAACGGSGRPGLLVHTERIDEGNTRITLEITSHIYVRPRRDTLQACLACGLPEPDPHHHQEDDNGGEPRDMGAGRENHRPGP